MELIDRVFSDYYHQYIVIEADDLTESLKDQIAVHNDDCFALCSSFIDQEGALKFNVLGIGNSWQRCTRGLRRRKMLGILNADEVAEKDSRLITPDMRMLRKNTDWILEQEKYADTDLLATRNDSRLDNVRDYDYPDVVEVGILHKDRIREYGMLMTGFNGPFLEGTLAEEPMQDIGIHLNTLIRALPYQVEDTFRLLAIFTGDHLSRKDQKAMQELIKEGTASGFGFSDGIMKS